LRSSLLEATEAACELERRVAERPLRWVEWLPNQWAFLRSRARIKQIRQGQQWGGKTTAALREVVGRCVGRHPLGADGWSYPSGPIDAWVICASWSQSLAIQAKLYAAIDPADLHPACVYDPVRGFIGRNPSVRFRNGSIIRIKTTRQGGLSLAGATIDVALFDEPPESQRVFSEVLARLTHRGGTLLLSYTPVNAPVAYLRELCERGVIEDHWSRLTPEAMIPVGRTSPARGPDGVLRDAAWIAALEAKYPAHEVGVVVHGEWEFRTTAAYFRDVWRSEMVHDRVPTGNVHVVMGFDHGTLPGKQIALLVAVDEASGAESPSIYVVDEYVDYTGVAAPSDDARAVLAMLRRNGIRWEDLTAVHGDRVHMPGSDGQKSNRDLTAHLLRELGVARLAPPVRTVKRGRGHGAGSLSTGSRWLHVAMHQGRFGLHPRCKRLVAALPKYTMADDDAKDPVDALRYALDPWIFRAVRVGATADLVVR
jgi:hypothetical protein